METTNKWWFHLIKKGKMARAYLEPLRTLEFDIISGTHAETKLINTAYESYTLVYNGTLWLGQNIV